MQAFNPRLIRTDDVDPACFEHTPAAAKIFLTNLSDRLLLSKLYGCTNLYLKIFSEEDADSDVPVMFERLVVDQFVGQETLEKHPAPAQVLNAAENIRVVL